MDCVLRNAGCRYRLSGNPRIWALGGARALALAQQANRSFQSRRRLQEVSSIYVTYLRILVWPMVGLGPVHSNTTDFSLVTAHSLSVDMLALGILAAAMLGFWKRHPLGGYVLCATVSLVPVLHIMPVAFDGSLYHERYVMMGYRGNLCVLMPVRVRRRIFSVHIGRALPENRRSARTGDVDRIRSRKRASDAATVGGQLDTLAVGAAGRPAIDRCKRSSSDHLHGPQRSCARACAGRLDCRREECGVRRCWLNAAHIAISGADIPRACLQRCGEAESRQTRISPDDSLRFLPRDYIFAVGQLLELQERYPQELQRLHIGRRSRMDPLNPGSQGAPNDTVRCLLAQSKGRPVRKRSPSWTKALASVGP